MLHVVSGCITRLWRDEMPSPLGACLALVLELDGVERERPHELEVLVIDEDGGEVARVQGGFQASGGDLTETANIPLAIDLRAAEIKRHGAYDVKIYVDGLNQGNLTFRALPREAGEGPTPSQGT